MPGAKLLTVVMVAALCGCRAQPPLQPEPRSGAVGATVIETEGAGHYEEQPNSFYDYPVAAPSNAMPVYPEDMLAQRLPPVRVKVRVIVSEAGVVSQCAPLDPADGADPRFVAAVQDAVRGWRYMPLVHVRMGPEKTSVTAHGHQTNYAGVATALPFREDYEFTFTQQDGRGSTSLSEPPGAAAR